MAAPGAFTIPNKAKLAMLGTAGLLSANAANYKLALIGSGWTPANSTDEVFADVTSEIAGGNGYTSGGIALSGVTLAQSAGTVTFSSSAAQWTASGSGIPAWRRGVVYYSGTLNGKVNPLVAHFLGDSAPADVPVTTAGNTLTVTPNAAGIVTAQ